MIKKFVFDIETFPDAFVAVFKEYQNDSRNAWIVFEICDFKPDDDRTTMCAFLNSSQVALMGYNNIGFDAQILQLILDGKVTTARQIAAAAKDIIESDKFPPYRESEITTPNLDFYLVGSYNTPSRQTSLKWLEYSMRMPEIQDLPFDHTEPVKTQSRLDQLIKYCKKDVKATEEVALRHEKHVSMRRDLAKLYGKRVLNKSNAQIGEYIIMHEYCKKTKRHWNEIKDSRPNYKELRVGDLILDFVDLKTPAFKEVLDDFKSLVLRPDKKSGRIAIKGAYERQIAFAGCEISYGVGGLHGQYEKGLYKSSNGLIIVSADVASMYPNIAIMNGFYPRHMGTEFCDVYGGIYDERKKHEKGTSLNLAYKEALNAVFGKSNSQYSPLNDPAYFLKTTINGQLMLTMLAEDLAEIGQPLMLNTDGVEFLIKESDYDTYMDICRKWEQATSVDLEYETYDVLVMRDVNNYIARTSSGKVKRKGCFLCYEDYVGDWHKNPSFTIIPKAISNYFLEGMLPEQTINEEANIFEFLAGIKGQKNFDYWLMVPDQKGIVGVERYSERAIRYFISKGGGTLYKHYNDGRKNVIQNVSGTSGFKTNILQSVKKPLASHYEELDRSYYVSEAWQGITDIIGEI